MPEETNQPQPQAQPSAPAPAPGQPPSQPTEDGVGKHLVAAFKTLALDPVGKMTEAYQALGPRRAVAMGAAFGAGFVVCSLVGAAIERHLNPDTGWRLGNRTELTAKETLAIILIGVVIVACLTLGSVIFRSLSKGGGSFSQDLYSAGLAVYPLSPALLLAGLTVTLWSHVLSYAVAGLGGIYLLITYYTAGTDILGLNKRIAAMMTAVVTLATVGVVYLLRYAFA
jgi:hypothetical protein